MMTSMRQPMTVVLAGGDGMRLRPLTERWLGRHVPKQYCAFTGTRSMLDHTIDRAACLCNPGRILTVVGRHHRDLLRARTARATDGAFIEEFYQYSRPSGLHIADDDTVYVADSASSRNGQHPGWEYGIRIGNLRTGSLDWFIDGSNPEGVTVAADGTVYGAVVAFGGALLRYVRPDAPGKER